MKAIRLGIGDLETILQENKRLIDEALLEILPKEHKIREIDLLYKMMRDYPSRPAKGLRSSLCLLISGALGADLKRALPTAVALELFQNWILIHDDIEDSSELRRGELVLQRKYSVPLAINAGDALHGKMWDVLYRNRDTLGEHLTLSIIKEFLRMINETTEGQHIELSWVESNDWNIAEEDYVSMCRKKTAWYTCITPSRLGFLVGRGKELGEDDLVRFGESLGVAFQIQDDILNLSADSKYGKENSGDILEGKRTLILIHLLKSASRDERERLKKILGKDRMDKDESDVAEILSLISKYKSIDYAKEKARKLFDVASAEFERIFGSIPESRDKAGLRQIMEYMVTRNW